MGGASETEPGHWGGLYCHRSLCPDRKAGKRPLCYPEFCNRQKRPDLCPVQPYPGAAGPYADACGAYTKEEIRQIAEEAGLPVAHKKDSQEICFVPDKDYAGFIEKSTGEKIPAGNYVKKDGTVIGEHKGIIHYTIGQRKGLNLSMGHPVFVTEIRPKTNEVVIGENEELFVKSLVCDRMNYMAMEEIREGEVLTERYAIITREPPAL